jgi:FkbM family methyltransferase
MGEEEPASSVEIAHAERYRRRSRIEILAARVAPRLRGTRVHTWLRAGFRRWLSVATRGRGLECVLPDGEVVWVAPEWRHLSWNPDEYQAFKAATPAGGVVLDVGANVGAYALLFGRWVGPTGRVIAVEPAPESCAGLRRHVELNGLGAIVSVVAAAASDNCGEVDFLLVGEGTSRMAAAGESGPVARVRVPAVTIDELCARHGLKPDVIKIDVEGFELAVLKGARETLRTAGDRLAVFVEMHPTTWRELGISAADVERELEAQGWKASPLRPHADMWAVEGECLRLSRR